MAERFFESRAAPATRDSGPLATPEGAGACGPVRPLP